MFSLRNHNAFVEKLRERRKMKERALGSQTSGVKYRPAETQIDIAKRLTGVRDSCIRALFRTISRECMQSLVLNDYSPSTIETN